MKKVSSILFLVFLLLMAGHTYAGQNSITTNYPAPIGYYTKVQLKTQANPDCTQSSNSGMVFMDTASGTLEMCMPGQPGYAATFRQECFNRFCSSTGAGTDNCGFWTGTPSPCPTGFTQMTLPGSIHNVDTFQPTPGTYVDSIACCTSNH